MSIALQLFFNTLIVGALYALLASGFSLIYSVTKILHLAHGATVVLVAYIFFSLGVTHDLNLVLAGALAILVGTIIGAAVYPLVYLPLKRRQAKWVAYLVGTLALLTIGLNLVQLWYGPGVHDISTFAGSRVWHLIGAQISTLQLVIIGTAMALLAALWVFLKKSRLGIAMRAVSDNETVAEIIGINAVKVSFITFILGSFLAGVAAVLVSLELNLEPQMGIRFAVKIFTAAVIGGIGSVPGALLGSFLIAFSEQLGIWYIGAGFKDAVAFLLLFVFLLVRPQGILGKK